MRHPALDPRTGPLSLLGVDQTKPAFVAPAIINDKLRELKEYLALMDDATMSPYEIVRITKAAQAYSPSAIKFAK